MDFIGEVERQFFGMLQVAATCSWDSVFCSVPHTGASDGSDHHQKN